jgi:hypothetical protein
VTDETSVQAVIKSLALLRRMSPLVARNGPTAVADLSPLFGEEQKSDFGDVGAAVDR